MKIIIFDIDGTMFDTKIGIVNCLNDVLLCYGKTTIPYEEQDKYIGPSIKDSLIKYNQFSEGLAIEATKKYRQKYVEMYVKESVPYEGLFELLHFIKENGNKICIATMKTRTQVDELLKLFDILDLFECIETAKDDGGYTKSDMLYNIKSRFGNSEYIFVGDTKGDYNAAIKCDIPFVFASYGYGELQDYSGSYINSLKELVRYI